MIDQFDIVRDKNGVLYAVLAIPEGAVIDGMTQTNLKLQGIPNNGEQSKVPSKDKKHRVCVDVEYSYRWSEEIEVDEEEYMQIICECQSDSITDVLKRNEGNALANGAFESDYAVFDLDEEIQLVDWKTI